MRRGDDAGGKHIDGKARRGVPGKTDGEKLGRVPESNQFSYKPWFPSAPPQQPTSIVLFREGKAGNEAFTRCRSILQTSESTASPETPAELHKPPAPIYGSSYVNPGKFNSSRRREAVRLLLTVEPPLIPLFTKLGNFISIFLFIYYFFTPGSPSSFATLHRRNDPNSPPRDQQSSLYLYAPALLSHGDNG